MPAKRATTRMAALERVLSHRIASITSIECGRACGAVAVRILVRVKAYETFMDHPQHSRRGAQITPSHRSITTAVKPRPNMHVPFWGEE